ncbi:mucin-13 [Bombina bombina]|uniref:mucin-13 n=1 Tax=Bombina bombina TaxID=8345 RepID=UPI00235B2196|nr:mucin-13 [Bombina bombina]
MKVQEHFKKCFSETQGYLGTVINKISTTSNRNVQLVVSLVNLFEPNSVKEEEVIKIISANGIEGQIGAYERKTVCDGFYCDTETTTCKAINNVNPPKCTCKEGRYSYTATYTSCRACDPNCIGADKHCVQALPSSIPECKCQPGYKLDSNTCKVCSFGFSGEECSDNYLLILVIIAAVGGTLILFSIGTIIGLSIRRKKNKSDSERTQLINKEINERGPATGGLFPKVHAKVDQGHVNRAVNPYEITDEYSRKTPKRDYDEDPWYEMSKKDRD